MKKAVVLGSSGFIGTHLVLFLKKLNYDVIGIDIRENKFLEDVNYSFFQGDIRDLSFLQKVIPNDCDELYQLAADMGGAGYVFTGCNDAMILQNSARINLNVAQICIEKNVKKLFFASSACVYPEQNQQSYTDPLCIEESAYPANPDSDYGWEKLTAERLYQAYNRNFNLDVKIGRLHNVYGIYCAWNNGKEKAPAALCRKVIEATNNGEIEIWGNGEQTRSFLHIDDCLNAIFSLMQSNFSGPYNIGSEEMISINDLAYLISEVAGKQIILNHIDGPIGVKGRVSENQKIVKDLNWSPKNSLKSGMFELYSWINNQK